MSTYSSNTSESLNQERLSLLKEQMIKIKLLSNDLELKSQQYELLKETLQSLDQQKLAILEQNQKLKSDIIAVILHNQQCQKQLQQKVEQIHSLSQKQLQLNRQLDQSKKQFTKLNQLITQANEQKNKLSLENQETNKVLKETIVRESNTGSSLSNFKKDNEIMAQKNKKLSIQISSINTQLASITEDLSLSKEQYSTLKSKYESLSHQAEQRKRQLSLAKQTIKEYSDRQSSFIMMQQQYYSTQKSMEKMQKQLRKIEKEHLLVGQQNILLKKQQQKHRDVEYDIGVLERVYDIGQSSRFEKMSNLTIDLIKSNERLAKQKTSLSQQVQQLQLLLRQQISKIRCLERQLLTSQSQYKLQLQSVISKYQSLKVSQQIKLKSTQQQLTQSINKSHQFNSISLKFQSQSKDLNERRAQMSQLQETNNYLKRTIEQMIVQCQESIQSKRKINLLKYVVANLIRHLFFAAKNIQQINIFKQYCGQILRSPKVKTKKWKLRSVARGVIFSIRLRNSLNKYRGLQSVHLKDKLVSKIVNLSYRLDQNHITASFLNELSSVLNIPSLTETVLTEKLLQLFEKNYSFQPIRYLSLKF